MAGFFSDFCAKLSADWTARERDERAFPELARKALEDAKLGERFTLDDLVDQVLAADPLPPQNNPEEDFGQPPITIAAGEGFVVELLFWIDGLVSVHQHGFSGAFQVFCGSSIHARHRFVETRKVNISLLLGDVVFEDAELLGPGNIREIPSGPRLVHATFHLERPTLTVVVRTNAESSGPQYQYHRPAVALDPLYARPTLRKRLQMLRMLHRVGEASYWRSIGGVLAKSDFLGAYLFLDQGFSLFPGEEARARLFGFARDAHGDAIEAVRSTVEATAARRSVLALRNGETDDDARFFLALLLTVPDRAALLALVAKRRPDVPAVDFVVKCLSTLGFNADACALGGALLAKKRDHRTVRVALARQGYRVENDYELLRAIRVLRETPGFASLFAE